MSTQTTNTNYSGVYSSYLSCDDDTEDLSEVESARCNYLRRKTHWSMSSVSYRRADAATQRCFRRATYFHQQSVKRCWEQCDREGLSGRTACYWDVGSRACIFLMNPDLGELEKSSMLFHVT